MQRVSLIALFAVSLSLSGHSEAQTATSIIRPEQYWGDTFVYMDKQSGALLDQAGKVLDTFKPGVKELPARRTALFIIDGVLHDPDAPKYPSVQAFYHARAEKAARMLETEKPPRKGATVTKLYDHGFIVRTKSVTIAFDITRGLSAGIDGFPMSEDTMRRLAGQCDALFVSHQHGDHAETGVAKLFLDAGKPVVAPENIWEKESFHSAVTHLDRDPDKVQTVSLGSGKSLQVVIFPGHQGDLLNNVSLVTTPEGLVFCHTGDQANDADFAWIDRAGKEHPVDVLMPNCWTTDIARVTRGFKARVVVTGHENELGHTIDHREPYWLTYRRAANIGCPLVLMTWGETFRYER